MASAVVKLLRAASIALCVIVALSMLLFALSSTSTASAHQQEELGSRGPARTAPSTQRENGLRKSVDEVAESVTSPVSGVASSSEWGEHAVRLLFALVVYGFGLGYVARVLRVRT